MSRARSELTDNLLLIAATTVLIVTARRYFRTLSPRPTRALPNSAAAQRCTFAPELLQRGRGRYSTNPLRIPWAGWKDILWRTYQRTSDDRLLVTAGVVFFGLLAVFPAITALVSSYGLFADPSTIGSNLQRLALMLPEGSFQIVQDQIARVLAKGTTALSATFLFGLLVLAIWSANAGVKAVIDALNVVYEEREKRSFIRLNLLAGIHHRRHRGADMDGERGGGVSAGTGSPRAEAAGPIDRQPGALATDVHHFARSARHALPLRAEPPRGANGRLSLRSANAHDYLLRTGMPNGGWLQMWPAVGLSRQTRMRTARLRNTPIRNYGMSCIDGGRGLRKIRAPKQTAAAAFWIGRRLARRTRFDAQRRSLGADLTEPAYGPIEFELARRADGRRRADRNGDDAQPAEQAVSAD
jgi:hypothetical protein